MTLQSTLSTIPFQKTHQESMLWVRKSVGRRFKAPSVMKKGPSRTTKKKLIRPLVGHLVFSKQIFLWVSLDLQENNIPMFQIKSLLQRYSAVGLYSYTWMIEKICVQGGMCIKTSNCLNLVCCETHHHHHFVVRLSWSPSQLLCWSVSVNVHVRVFGWGLSIRKAMPHHWKTKILERKTHTVVRRQEMYLS